MACVCGAGLGSGLTLRLTVEKALEKHGLKYMKDYTSEVMDVSTAISSKATVFVTSPAFANRIRSWKEKNNRTDWIIVPVQNFFSVDDMEARLIPKLKEAGYIKK